MTTAHKDRGTAAVAFFDVSFLESFLVPRQEFVGNPISSPLLYKAKPARATPSPHPLAYVLPFLVIFLETQRPKRSC